MAVWDQILAEVRALADKVERLEAAQQRVPQQTAQAVTAALNETAKTAAKARRSATTG